LVSALTKSEGTSRVASRDRTAPGIVARPKLGGTTGDGCREASKKVAAFVSAADAMELCAIVVSTRPPAMPVIPVSMATTPTPTLVR